MVLIRENIKNLYFKDLIKKNAFMSFSNYFKVGPIYIIILCFAFFLLFYNLDDRLLWRDEAETALLAINIGRYGIPKTIDERNNITLFGSSVDANMNNVWTWSPWLDEYITAASFSILGENTFAARLPFAIFSFLSLISFIFLAKSIYKKHEIVIIATFLFSTSELFILLSRQCRYYSVIIFAQILLVWALYYFFEKKTKQGTICMIFALSLQFYSNYIIVVGNLIALGSLSLISYKKRPDILRAFAFSFFIFIIIALPWIVYAKPWHQAGEFENEYIFRKGIYYLLEIHFYLFPLVFLLFPVAGYISRFIKKEKLILKANYYIKRSVTQYNIELFLWLLIPSYLLILVFPPGFFIRYLSPLIPCLMILLTVILQRYIRRKLILYTIVALLSFTNYISIYSAYPVKGLHEKRLPVTNIIKEISSSYTNRLEDVIAFLKKEALPEDVIFSDDPEFPLIFYSRMKIIDGRLTKLSSLKDLPDWIFSEDASGVRPRGVTLPSEIAKMYQAVPVMVHNSSRGGSRPDPNIHESFTVKDMKKYVVFKKKRG